jgi:hypothetical protein
MIRASLVSQLYNENFGIAHRFSPSPSSDTDLGSFPKVDAFVVIVSDPLVLPACFGENVTDIPHEPPGASGVEQPEWFSVKSPVTTAVMLFTAEFV